MPRTVARGNSHARHSISEREVTRESVRAHWIRRI